MLRVAFELAGLTVISTYTHMIRDGQVDIEAMMRLHDPKVIVYDIAPPYAANWQLFQHVASLPVMQGRFFILSTMNTKHVEKLASESGLPIFEIVDTPHNLSVLIDEVWQALRARPTR